MRAKKTKAKLSTKSSPADDVWIGIKYEPNEWHGGIAGWCQVDEAWERRVKGSNYDAAETLRRLADHFAGMHPGTPMDGEWVFVIGRRKGATES